MLFSRDKDDDEDFIPNPNYHSNLASIFGSGGSRGDNSSLTYTPPKQPKRQNKPPVDAAAPTSSTTRSSSVICAKIVQTFKMIDGSYQSQGKMGAAVVSISSEESTIYQLLLYRDKQNHLCNTNIAKDFKYHVQPKNYCTFYNKQSVIWSIFFDSPADMAEFNLQVAKCRWKAEEANSPFLIQDLWCPNTNGDIVNSVAAIGDTAEITYTLQTIKGSGVPEESQRVVVEVEETGWKQALLGVQLNSQRVIILQPFMLGDLNPKEVAYNSAVLVQFTVVQVSKVSRMAPPADLPVEENKNQEKEVLKPQPAVTKPPTVAKHPTVLEDSSDGPKSPKASKADLINRMARMGQALPFKKAGPTPSDSDETEEDYKTPVQRYGKIVPKPRARVQHFAAPPPAPVDHTESPAATPVAITQPQVQWTAGITPYMLGNMYSVPQVSSPVDPHSHFNMFLSEVRTTNSELRMGITRLTDKVEALQSKINDSDKKTHNHDIDLVMERLTLGEQQLKDQLQQVLSAVQNLQPASQPKPSVQSDEPAQPGLPTFVKPCQQCAELQQTHTSLFENIKRLQEENEYLRTSLAAQKDALLNAKIVDKDQMAQIEIFQRQKTEDQRNISELNQSLENLQRVNETLSGDLQTAKNSIVDLQNTLREKQTSIDRLEQALKDSEATKLEEVRRNLQEVLDPKPVISEHIKKILNAVYRLVKVQFEPKNKYDSTFIQSVLAETIKAVTLEYLQNGDLFIADTQQQNLASGRLQVSTSSDKEQDNSAMSSEQTVKEEVKGQYLSRDQRSTVDVDFNSSGMAVSSSQQISSDRLGNESATILVHTNKEGSSIEENFNAIDGNITPLEGKAAGEPSLALIDSTDESSDDVWRPQPPHPPLFEEDQNEDDWLNC